MTKRGFLSLDWRGEGVVGLGRGQGIGVESGLELGFLGNELEAILGLCLELERVGEGEGDGDALEKKEVI